MSSLFAKTATEAKLEQQEDRLGGGAGIKETSVYIGDIVSAYFHEADSGAQAVVLEVKLEDGSTYNETLYVTSGTDKGCLPYFVKDGKQIPLPGYARMNDICIITTDKELFEQDHELKTLRIYDFESKKEIPREVPVFVDLIGQTIALAIQKVRENKNVKNESTGKWEATNEERISNNIVSVYHPEAKVTVYEAMKEREPTHWDKWLEKNDQVTYDKYKEVTTNGRARSSNAGKAAAEAEPRKSMFKK